LRALNSHHAQLRLLVTKFKHQQTEDKLIIRKTASHPYVAAFPSQPHSLHGGAEPHRKKAAPL